MTKELPISTGAWLLITTEHRAHGGNVGYEDALNSSYKWDDTVKYHSRLKRGDLIVLFDKDVLLGASIIDNIEVTQNANKQRFRCPKCKSTSIKPRITVLPLYRCQKRNCGNEFDVPISEVIRVKTYESKHEAGWVDLEGLATGQELRAVTTTPKAPDSIRPLYFDQFLELMRHSAPEHDLKFLKRINDDQLIGHSTRQVRVRTGQGQFRTQLLERYGEQCAITGRTHPATIEACHLYSYAKVGKHHEHGGVLLRRDLHALFDKGLITVDPLTSTVMVAKELMEFPQYASLASKQLQIDLNDEQLAWIRAHQLEFNWKK